MTPVIRISDATWERLKKFAIPLEDTPEDAVRRILEIAEAPRVDSAPTQPSHGNQDDTLQQVPNRADGHLAPNTARRLPRGRKTPNEAYERPILETLHGPWGKRAYE